MNIVFDEIKKLILPIFVQTLIAYVFFHLHGYGGVKVFATLVFSNFYSLLNFWSMGAAISVALKKSSGKAQMYMQMQYFVRYIITGSLIYYAIKLPDVNVLAFVVPMFFIKTSLILRSLKSK